MTNHSSMTKENETAGVPDVPSLHQGIASGADKPAENSIHTVKPMKIHPVAGILVALAWPMMGFFFCMVVKKAFKIEIPKPASSIVNLLVAGFGLFLLFPKIYRAPFGAIPLKEYLTRIGLYFPVHAWKHILLGIALAGCTLAGMLISSFMTGRYVVNWSTVNPEHILFSLNPGIFEEVFYRGIIVMLLLPLTRSLWKALLLQIVIFGLAHIKGLDLPAFIDAFSVAVIAIAFTYAAFKTRALLAGIVFHSLHDSFLFFVQVPEGVYMGMKENIVFYGMLWFSVGIGCLLIWFAGDYLHVQGEHDLYR